MVATLTRYAEDQQGTRGVLVTDQGFSCQTLELPWRENQRSVSCIPEGVYECVWTASEKFPRGSYILQGVNGRSGVRIHSGNFAGDVAAGWQSHIEGCILLGRKWGWAANRYGVKQLALLNSRSVVTEFNEFAGRALFVLEVINGLV